MAMKCQVVRPLCLNIGIDKHSPAMQAPFIPVPAGWFFNIATTEWVVGDKQHGTVKQQNNGLIKLGHDCQYLRPHLPFPAPCPEVIFWAIFTALGSSKTAWGSFRTKHGGEPTAVMFMGFGSPVAVINQTNCSDFPLWPNIISLQMPTNVFAGISLGDFLGCVFQLIVEAVINYILNKVSEKGAEKLTKMLGKVGTKLASKLMKAPGLRNLVDKALAQTELRQVTKILLQFKNNPFRYDMAQHAVDRALPQLTEKFGEQLAKVFVDKSLDKVKDAIKKPIVEGENTMKSWPDRIGALVDGRPYTPEAPHAGAAP